MARKYELKQRAEKQAETRRRIVQAAVDLHGTVGPAKTTISAIARRAIVERRTFYRHFPDPDEIFDACSASFRAQHPPPDPKAWLSIADPERRLSSALEQCYRYYRRHEGLIDNVLRDRELGIPVGDGFLNHRTAARRTLAEGFSVERQDHRQLNAALELALDFHTWQTLRRNGLSDRQASELASAVVTAAVNTSSRR
jgi:AcrR family transcriptional regulator